MDGEIDGIPTADYLWDKRGIVPFLKVDQGLMDGAERRAVDEADERPRRTARSGPSPRTSSAPRCAR
jgi:fructose-bisphosphate aldolase class 1